MFFITKHVGFFKFRKEKKIIDEKPPWKINVKCEKCGMMEYENGIETHFEKSDHNFEYPPHEHDFHALYISENELTIFKAKMKVFEDSIVVVKFCKICNQKNSHLTRKSILDEQGLDYRNMPFY